MFCAKLAIGELRLCLWALIKREPKFICAVRAATGFYFENLPAASGAEILDHVLEATGIGSWNDSSKQPSARYVSENDYQSGVWTVAYIKSSLREDLTLKLIYPSPVEDLAELGLSRSQINYLSRELQSAGGGIIMFSGIDDTAQAHTAIRSTLNLLPAGFDDISYVAENFYQSFPHRISYRIRHEELENFCLENKFLTRIVALEESVFLDRPLDYLFGLVRQRRLVVCQTIMKMPDLVFPFLMENYTAEQIVKNFCCFVFLEQESLNCPECIFGGQLSPGQIDCQSCFDFGKVVRMKPACVLPCSENLLEIMRRVKPPEVLKTANFENL